jgi:hypothetical protein
VTEQGLVSGDVIRVRTSTGSTTSTVTVAPSDRFVVNTGWIIVGVVIACAVAIAASAQEQAPKTVVAVTFIYIAIPCGLATARLKHPAGALVLVAVLLPIWVVVVAVVRAKQAQWAATIANINDNVFRR